MPHILIIDNHDSFVYNLVQLVREAEESCQFTLIKAQELKSEVWKDFDALLISPGPGLPTDFPLMMQALRDFADAKKPILGICLGCQAIATHYGYGLQQLSRPLHGHTSYLQHDAQGILQGLPQGLAIGRYHSWVVDLGGRVSGHEDVLLERGYTTDIDGRHTMIISHRSLPIWGILFHPESIISVSGSLYIRHWLRLVK